MIITVAVIKGGTGKTTTAAALAQCAAADGKKVLCVDMDAQANLTTYTGAQIGAGTYDVLAGRDAGQTLIQHTGQMLDVLAGSANLAAIRTRPGSSKRLQTALERYRSVYDMIVVDTPPQLGELTYNAINAADSILVPLEADAGSVQGLQQIAGIAAQMQRQIAGCIITRYAPRSRINQQMEDIIRDMAARLRIRYLGGIRQCIAVREAQSLRQSLYDYAPKSNSAKDYRALYETLIRE